MREILRRHPITAALCAVGVLLALVIVAEVVFGMKRAPAGAPGATANPAFTESKLMPSLASTSAEQAYPETGSRPLFSPNRRPAPVLTASPAISRGQYILQGVTIVGDLRIALLKDKTGGRVFRVEKGRELNGITLSEVEPDRVTLRSGSDSEVIPLNVQRGAPGSGAPSGAPAASAAAVGGPFTAPAAPPAAPPSQPPPAAASDASRPAGGAQAPNSGLPNGGPADFGPRPRPAAPAQGASGAAQEAAPMSAEELLARRRARRQGQSQ